MDINFLKNKFKEYVLKFDNNDEKINLKYFHSLRVLDISKSICKSLNLNKEEEDLALIIGLLHDYARFPQWELYKTFEDLKSVDHGDLAIKLLFDNNEIECFEIDSNYLEKIKKPIKYHNKLSLPNDLDDQEELLCKIIRDADKLDILYLVSENKIFIKDNTCEISKEVEESFYNEESISREKVKKENDEVVLKLAFVFDLNFKYSYNYLKREKIIEKIYENINNKVMFSEYFNYIYKYIEERTD